jgi:hypothetical protein
MSMVSKAPEQPFPVQPPLWTVYHPIVPFVYRPTSANPCVDEFGHPYPATAAYVTGGGGDGVGAACGGGRDDGGCGAGAHGGDEAEEGSGGAGSIMVGSAVASSLGVGTPDGDGDSVSVAEPGVALGRGVAGASVGRGPVIGGRPVGGSGVLLSTRTTVAPTPSTTAMASTDFARPGEAAARRWRNRPRRCRPPSHSP